VVFILEDCILSVRGRSQSRTDERVSTLDGELRACKTKHVLCRDRLAQKGTGGESVPKHGEVLCVKFRSECDDAQCGYPTDFLNQGAE
jgi:hypothetical protein